MKIKSLLLGSIAALAMAGSFAALTTPAEAFWLQNNSSYTVDAVWVINHDGSWSRNYFRSGGYFVPDDGGDIPKTVRGSCYYDVVVNLQGYGQVTMYNEDLCGEYDVELTDDYLETDY